MATILLIFIYIFYIGLGIPDSLLGSAWPAIYGKFHVPVSYASIISAIIFHRNSSIQPFQYKNHCQTGNSKGHRSFQRVLPQSLY